MMSRPTNPILPCLLALLISAAVHADDGGKQEGLSIKAQPLASALREFSAQTGLQIGYSAELADGKQSRGVEGIDDPETALDALLASSGLEHRFVNGSTVIIQETLAGEQEGGDRDSKNLPAASAIMAQNSPRPVSNPPRQANGQNSSRQNGDGQTERHANVITGVVQDARTGAYLKGAKLTIEETGQWTRTDGLGRYRFPAVTPGERELTVSFLGYADQSATVLVGAGGPVVQGFALYGGSVPEEIVVFGTRSARAQALNQERTAANVSTVISADLLGNFTGTTISEALRRAPGVAFQQNPLTGAGTNIIVRGLEPDFNIVKLNGLELPVGDGKGRSADLSNLLADSVESITIHKSLLPSHDSAGTGGLIEIETKSPLDRSKRYMNFLVEGAERGGDFSEDLLVSGTVSASFGNDDTLGLSASVQYRDQTNTNVSYEMLPNFGQYLPLDEAGSTRALSFFFLDPGLAFPWEESAAGIYVTRSVSEANEVSTENLALTLSSEWQPADHTNLRFDYQRSVSDSSTRTRRVALEDNTRYRPQPVPSLGGEVRRALFWDGTVRVDTNYNRKDIENETDVLSFRGITDAGPWRASYDAGYTTGTREVPQQLSFSTNSSNLALAPYALPEATNAEEGRVITLFGVRRGDGLQLPLITPAGFDELANLSSYRLNNARLDVREVGESERYTAAFKLRRSFDHPSIRYLEAGVAYEGSRFKSAGNDTPFLVRDNGGADLAALGLALDTIDLARIGFGDDVRTVSWNAAERFLGSVFTRAEADPLLTLRPPRLRDPLLRQGSTEEDEFAAYLETQLDVGDWEFVGGVRATRVEVTAINRTGPVFIDENGNDDPEFEERFTRLVTQTAAQTDVLPRVLVNYRPSENLVFRGSYHLTVARPRIRQLSDQQRIRLDLEPDNGPNSDRPALRVDQGNPDLNPTTTDNYDLSIEYYDKRIGVVKLGAFYKRMKDFIQSNADVDSNSLEGVELPNDPRFLPENLPANLFIDRSQPENSEDPADIWGFEVAIERQLTFLPSIWNGLGVFANYTYSDSSKTVFLNWNQPQFDAGGNFTGYERQVARFDDVAFDEQPKESGTAALTYNKYGIDATLAYSYQDRRFTGFFNNGFGIFDDSSDSLDFRVEYRFDIGDSDFRVYFEGADILDGNDDPAVLRGRGGVGSTPEVFTAGAYLGGREFRLGFASTF